MANIVALIIAWDQRVFIKMNDIVIGIVPVSSKNAGWSLIVDLPFRMPILEEFLREHSSEVGYRFLNDNYHDTNF